MILQLSAALSLVLGLIILIAWSVFSLIGATADINGSAVIGWVLVAYGIIVIVTTERP